MGVGRRVGSVRHACRTLGWELKGMCVGCRVGSVRHACRMQSGVCQACV